MACVRSTLTLRGVVCQEPDRRFTYASDYQHSGTMVVVDTDAEARQQKQANVERRVAPFDWRYPGKRTFQESNQHPRRPDACRIDELKQVQSAWLHTKSCVFALSLSDAS